MKIVYLSDEFPPNITGGAAVAAYSFADALLKKGHDVFVITAVSDRSQAGKRKYNGLKIFSIYSKYPAFLRNYLNIWNPFAVGKIKKIFEEIKPDIVHAHNVHAHLSYHSLKLAKKNGAKVFLTAHDTMLASYDKLFFGENCQNYKLKIFTNIKSARKRYNPIRNIAIKHYLKYVDTIFAISAILKKFLAQNGVKSEVLYNGIDISKWQMPHQSDIETFKKKFGVAGKKIIFFGGRLSGAKGALQIIKALSIVLKRLANKNAVLLIAGREPQEENKIKMTVKEYNLTRNVIFTGWLERAEMKTAFFVSDVCVTPSVYFDPFNLFNIEAMAAGKPVVGTCFGGTPEIVADGETGYVANPLDERTFADKILDILENNEKAEEFGKKGKLRAEELFSLSKQTDKLINWYKK